MKKTYSLIIIAFVLSTIVGVQAANAQTVSSSSRESKLQKQLDERKAKLASSTTKIQEQLKEREAKLASTTEKLNAKFAEREAKIASSTIARQEKLADRFKTGVSNQIAKVIDNLTEVLNNLKSIDARIVSRIAKLKAENIDTTKAESLLPDAQTKMTTAIDKINSLQTSVSSVLAGGVSTTTKATIKAKITDVRNSVKAAHEAYVQVIKNLKSDKAAPENSTSTVSTSTSSI